MFKTQKTSRRKGKVVKMITICKLICKEIFRAINNRSGAYKKRGEWNIPDYELEAIVRCFLPDIQAFFATEEGQKCLEEYRARKKAKEKEKASMTA